MKPRKKSCFLPRELHFAWQFALTFFLLCVHSSEPWFPFRQWKTWMVLWANMGLRKGWGRHRSHCHQYTHLVLKLGLARKLSLKSDTVRSKSPLDHKEINPVNRKGNQTCIFIGRTDAEAPTLWPPDTKSWLIGKDPDAGKDWGQEEKWGTGDEMVK